VLFKGRLYLIGLETIREEKKIQKTY
jgi:hypothetical protein